MTVADLRQAEARYQRASARSEALRRERNALVLAALSEGWSQRQVAAAMGLSAGRVGQIALTSPR